ncbi:TrgA family protein [Roseovarius sp. MMSF_3281]|uniref:TrgA family protein n=1 Tax=Roseovarius sp. MMSF_3281 TaxID=3046694 RepID=UPI0027400DCC|nr:TrgA family protein [Roseovarius sp. MMSF_3281]
MPYTDHMPTAGKLFAAAGLGAVGWIASDLIRPLMPPHTDFGAFNIVNLVLGILCGWVTVGTRLGYGYRQGVAAGLTGAAALVFWGLFVQSANEMLDQALQKKYKGPMDAANGLFEIAVDFGQYLLDQNLIIALVVGGVVVGLFGEWAEQRWQ